MLGGHRVIIPANCRIVIVANHPLTRGRKGEARGDLTGQGSRVCKKSIQCRQVLVLAFYPGGRLSACTLRPYLGVKTGRPMVPRAPPQRESRLQLQHQRVDSACRSSPKVEFPPVLCFLARFPRSLARRPGGETGFTEKKEGKRFHLPYFQEFKYQILGGHSIVPPLKALE